MAYQLKGSYFENCSCEVACPCGASNLALPATYDRCEVMLVFHFVEGDIDGVDVAGTTAIMIADTPAQMTDGDWRVGLILDEDTSEDQRNALISVMSGEQGGTPAMFAPMVGEMLGIEYAPVDYTDDGRRHAVRVGDFIDVEVEDFEGADEGSVMTLNGIGHPGGSTLSLARATRSRIQAFGLDLELVGRNGHAAQFEWSG